MTGWLDQIDIHLREVHENYTRLLLVAEGRVPHRNMGDCPDGIEGYDQRDPDCTACNWLIDAEEELNGEAP